MPDKTDPVELSKDHESVVRLYNKMVNQLSTYKDKSSISVKDRDHVTAVSFNFSKKGQGIPSRGEVKNAYDTLLLGKVTDETTKKQVVKYAELIMQPTTYGTIDLLDQGVSRAVVTVYACLPEHGQAFVDWWQGRIVEREKFNTLVKQFEREMQNRYAIGRAEARFTSDKSDWRVGGVLTDFTFA